MCNVRSGRRLLPPGWGTRAEAARDVLISGYDLASGRKAGEEHHAAVDEQGRACDVVGSIRHQPCDRLSRIDLPCGKEAFDLDRARILRSRKRDGFLLLLVFIVKVGGAFVSHLAKVSGNGWRAYPVGLRGTLLLTRPCAHASRALKVSVLDYQKVVLTDLIPPRLVCSINGLVRDRIDQFVFEAMARSPVDLPK